ncbi:hypothetical protein [Fretibacterium fastidiosum]|uniref:MORN repeat n=1 Tax=Fretibacterium fastidiosum TaxID=651822 RepID=A0AB94IXB0_9BACT|nr:hypothetical protein [Fretibacterium fastidiosum]CBL28377.1 hypothetical protein SY1_12230 [Fretibacterium fastidiosum]
MKTMKVRALCAAFFLAFLALPAPSAEAANWLDNADISWYEDVVSANPQATEFEISTPEEFAGLVELTQRGNAFEGKTVSLKSDLDLNGAEWTPVGTFSGVFDGKGHVVKGRTTLFSHISGEGALLRGLRKVGDSSGSGLVKVLSKGTVEDCFFKGAVLTDPTPPLALP